MLCRVFPAQPIPGREVRELANAFGLWSSVWTRTMQSLTGERIYADELRINTDILSVESNGEAAMLVAFQEVDLVQDYFLKSRWFRSWENEDLNKVSRLSPLALIAGHFTIAEKFRRKIQGYSSIHLLGDLYMRYFRDHDFPLMVASTRMDLGLDRFNCRLGAEIVRENVTLNNVPVANIIFRKPVAHFESKEGYGAMAEQLWQDRLDYRKHKHPKKGRHYELDGTL